jgi:hypothetical protein
LLTLFFKIVFPCPLSHACKKSGQLSRYSDHDIGTETAVSWSDYRQRKRFLSSSTSPYRLWRPAQKSFTSIYCQDLQCVEIYLHSLIFLHSVLRDNIVCLLYRMFGTNNMRTGRKRIPRANQEDTIKY